jgi:hypothetical protein
MRGGPAAGAQFAPYSPMYGMAGTGKTPGYQPGATNMSPTYRPGGMAVKTPAYTPGGAAYSPTQPTYGQPEPYYKGEEKKE